MIGAPLARQRRSRRSVTVTKNRGNSPVAVPLSGSVFTSRSARAVAVAGPSCNCVAQQHVFSVRSPRRQILGSPKSVSAHVRGRRSSVSSSFIGSHVVPVRRTFHAEPVCAWRSLQREAWPNPARRGQQLREKPGSGTSSAAAAAISAYRPRRRSAQLTRSVAEQPLEVPLPPDQMLLDLGTSSLEVVAGERCHDGAVLPDSGCAPSPVEVERQDAGPLVVVSE